MASPKTLSSGGFSLVEVTIAIGLMSFCLVAMLGILPVGLSQERKSSDQMASLQALTAVVSDFQNAPMTAATTTPQYGISMVTSGSSSFWMDENFAKTTDLAAKRFDVSYTMEPAQSRFSNYRMWVKVSRTSQTVTAANVDRNDYVESVALKSAM